MSRTFLCHTTTLILATLKTLLIIGICQSYAYANSLDSLKRELNHAVEDSSKCSILSSIFGYYEVNKDIDSLYAYAAKTMKSCNLGEEAEMNIVTAVINKLFKDNHKEFIDSLILSHTYKLDDSVDKLLYYTKIAERAYLSGNNEQFDFYLDKSKKYLFDTDANLSKAYYYNLWGYYNMNKGNILTALQSYKISLSFIDTTNLEYFKYSLDLGTTYNIIGEHKKAVELFERNIKIAKVKRFSRIERFSNYGLIFSYHLMKRYDDCIQLCHEVIKLGSTADLGYLYSSLGDAYLMSSKRDSAMYYFKKGLEIAEEQKDFKVMHESYIGIANYFREIKDYRQAKKFYKKALKVETYIFIPELYQNLANIYLEEKDYKNAYLYLNKLDSISINNKSEKKADIQLAAQLMEDANEYKQKTEREIYQSKIKQERLFTILIVATGLIIFILGLLYFIQKNREKLSKLNDIIFNRNKQLNIALNNQKESIKYLENFAAVAAHDLKAPIHTASSFAGLLVKKSENKFTEKELIFLNYINKSINQLTFMIDDLLNLSKLGTNLPEEVPVDLSEVLVKVKNYLSKIISESNTQIIVVKELPIVSGHQSLLIQLFQNLMKNSIVHKKNSGNAIIKIDYQLQEDKSCLIMVSDNSGGIPDFILPTLFDLFSSSDKNSGNGIGLAICKKIITHYGGNIWVTVEKNVGSTFHFTLPLPSNS